MDRLVGAIQIAIRQLVQLEFKSASSVQYEWNWKWDPNLKLGDPQT
jgi:hypothetical protein